VTQPSRLLFHASDLHFGYEDRAALDWFADEVARDRPEAVICTGDLTMRGSAREFAAAQDYLTSLAAPVWLVPGNHDVPYVPLKTVARAQFRLNWSKGRVSETDLDAALHELAHHGEAALKLVACHHPLVGAPGARSPSTRGGQRALAALARAGASVVLSGHVHDPFDLTIDCEGQPMRLIGAGTLSQRLRSSLPSYNRLLLSSDGSLDVSIRQAETA